VTVSSGIVLLGPPAGGKGTHAARLAKELDLDHIATGDILRRQVAEGTDLGRRAKEKVDAGDLVADEVMLSLVEEALAARNRDWILDGFPRDLAQARLFEAILAPAELRIVLELQVPDEDVVSRAGGRRVCARGHTYHVTDNPPRRDGICDDDDEPLKRREDDEEDVVRRRLSLYRKEAGPLLAFYRAKRLLRSVDASGRLDEAYRRIRAAVELAREPGAS